MVLVQTNYLILVRRPDLVLINKKKRNYHLVNFAISADCSVKIKEREKIDKDLDLVR